MTLSDMLADCYRKTNHPASPASAVTTRFTALLNEGLQELISLPGLGAWVAQHQPALTVASVASTPILALPPGISRVESIRDTTNDRTLVMRSREWYHAMQPDPTTETGTPEVWVPYGYQAVAKQPSNASEIFVDSTSASDTNTAYIEGIRTGGYPKSLSVTMTGVTAVSLGTAYTDFLQITKFYLSAAAVGTVTLHEDASGGTELARIPIGQTFARYQAVALWPTPASALTYTVDGERDLPLLINGTDEPLIPSRFHRLSVEYALWKEFEKLDDTRAGNAERRWLKGVSDFRYFATCPPDYLPVSGERLNLGRSRLGAYYQAD